MNYLILLFLSISFISCQKELSEVVLAKNPKEEDIEIVEIEFPEFRGGEKELRKYISAKLENLSVRDDKCGEIVLRFEISAKGKVENVTIVRGGERCLPFKEQLISIFYNMPKWKPGLSNNQQVKYNM